MALNLRTKREPGSETLDTRRGRSSIPDGFPSPADIGMPDKFTHWRPGQVEAFSSILEREERFICLCCPTGYGKSILAMAAPLLSGQRTAILTSTKGLQDQLKDDFHSISSDIRGQGNYLCPIARSRFQLPDSTPVNDAPCQCGFNCGLRRGGCDYFDTYRAAQESKIFVTNYACWLYDGLKLDAPNGDLQFGWLPARASEEVRARLSAEHRLRILILDEAHAAPDHVSDFVGVELTRRECLAMKLEWPNAGESVEYWHDWAVKWLGNVVLRRSIVEEKLKSQSGTGWAKEFKHLRDIERKLGSLAGIKAEDDWVMNEEGVQGRSMLSVKFDPLNPARYAEKVLFRGVEKVVLVSATLRPKTADLLGIPRDQMVFDEYDSSFDPKRRPVIHVDTVRMDFHTEQDDVAMMKWLGRIDGIIRARQDRKGIVHAVSYKRMKFILDNSEYSSIMMTHGTRDRASVVEEFKRSKAPRVLVSPSVDTGYDFAGDSARYQIIAKIPFASTQDKVIKARQDRDKEYGLYLAAQTMVQMSGRIVRSEKDFGETFIIDDQAKWFVYKVRKFIPQWWMDSYRSVATLPLPIQFPDESKGNDIVD